MAKRPQQASAKSRRPHPPPRIDPRYEIVFDKRKLSNLFAELKSLSERSSSVIGAVYARAASSFLNQSEHLADLNAERRFKQRSRPRPRSSAEAPVAVRALAPEAISSTPK
jgi:hypothetical protein